METNNNIKFNCKKCDFKCRFESQWIKHIET